MIGFRALARLLGAVPTAVAEEAPDRCRVASAEGRCVLGRGHPGPCALPGDLGTAGTDKPGILGSVW